MVDLSHRSGERVLPAVRQLRLRDPGVGREPALLGQRLRRDDQPDRHRPLLLRVLPGPSATGVHTGSGTQFYYPAQAAQGADGTIYTADPLNTIEATSPQGYFESSTTLGQNSNGGGNLAMGGYNFYLVGSTFFYQGGPPFNNGADNISSISLSTLTAYLDAIQAPTDSLGWGAGLSSPAAGNYFAPGTTPRSPPTSIRGGSPMPPTSSCPTRWRTPPRSTPRRCPAPPPSTSPPPPPGWPISP